MDQDIEMSDPGVSEAVFKARLHFNRVVVQMFGFMRSGGPIGPEYEGIVTSGRKRAR